MGCWRGPGVAGWQQVHGDHCAGVVAGKRTRAGEEMVVVGVEKKFENQYGVAAMDRR